MRQGGRTIHVFASNYAGTDKIKLRTLRQWKILRTRITAKKKEYEKQEGKEGLYARTLHKRQYPRRLSSLNTRKSN